MRIATAVTLLLLSQAVPLWSQDFDRREFDVMLLPVQAKDAPGAFGSLWNSSLVMTNWADLPARFYPAAGTCPFLCPVAPFVDTLASGETRFPITMIPHVGQPPGTLLFVSKDVSDRVALSLRIVDSSRQSSTFGTEIPVVRESEFLTADGYLFTARVEPGFRQFLRLYEIDARRSADFLVQFRDTKGVMLYEMILTTVGSGLPFSLFTGYVGLDLGFLFPDHEGEQIAILVRPLTAGIRYWAFVSVTHNESQHVTIITPQ